MRAEYFCDDDTIGVTRASNLCIGPGASLTACNVDGCERGMWTGWVSAMLAVRSKHDNDVNVVQVSFLMSMRL